MFEIIRWISVALCWVAIGINIYAMVRLQRTRREPENQVRIWKARNRYEEEKQNETDAL